MRAPRPRPDACRFLAAAACFAGAAALALSGLGSPPAAAFFDEPAPKIDCSKKENRSKPQCKKSQLGPGTGPKRDTVPALASRSPENRTPNEEMFFAAYGLARAGQYAAALDILKAGDQSDPRVLNYQGFATRKLGDVDGALPFYRRALAINPDYVLARAYMGEAFLQQGETGAARGQLHEIERRCGRVCAEYVDLAMQIDAHGAALRGG